MNSIDPARKAEMQQEILAQTKERDKDVKWYLWGSVALIAALSAAVLLRWYTTGQLFHPVVPL